MLLRSASYGGQVPPRQGSGAGGLMVVHGRQITPIVTDWVFAMKGSALQRPCPHG